MNALTEWLAVTDAELTKRSAVEGMPINLDAEVAWSKVIIYIFLLVNSHMFSWSYLTVTTTVLPPNM